MQKSGTQISAIVHSFRSNNKINSQYASSIESVFLPKKRNLK